MQRKTAAERTHEYFRKLNPEAKKHELLRWGLNQQAFLTKPIRKGDELDIKGTISAIKKESVRSWQFWKGRFINGSAIDVDAHLDRVLYPIREYTRENPRAASKSFKKELDGVIDALEKRRGGRLTTLAAGKRADPDGVYSKEHHELIHRHLNDIIGRSISTGTREGARTHEGATSFFEIYLSGLYEGKRFDDAIAQFEDKEHNELYAEPAKMLHEMVAKGQIISEGNIDKKRVLQVFEKMKEGKTIDQIYREFKKAGDIQ